MSESRRLDPPPSLSGMSLRVLHRECRAAGCAGCGMTGFVWRSTYAPGSGEQSDDFADLNESAAAPLDPLLEVGHA